MRSPLPFTYVLLHDTAAFWDKHFLCQSWVQGSKLLPCFEVPALSIAPGDVSWLAPSLWVCERMLCSSDFWPGVEYCVFKKKNTPKLELVSRLLCLQELDIQKGGSKSSPGRLGEAGVRCCVTTLFTQVPLQTAHPGVPARGVTPAPTSTQALASLTSCRWRSATASAPATAVMVPSVPARQSPFPPGTA